MQSRIQLLENKVTEKPFPKLMKTKNGLVVFFRQPEIGTVVQPNTAWKVGDHSRLWDMRAFSDVELEYNK